MGLKLLCRDMDGVVVVDINVGSYEIKYVLSLSWYCTFYLKKYVNKK